ncbi:MULTISPECIES: hypothetical protein [Burkholderia]|uniref:Uncharacterized protein n=1 Tax=Burkholderia savannae TaxID=1637837 RepID=A0ABR5TGN6_9BURK|nr:MULTISPECIES: hypothetical protein [Burkholderia]KGS07666.1 hypothetical protein X946_2100 [Burkholderia sp. ABCPW 111]KVK81138.1 hypothetical protein WS91_11405 [Burkholderia sp. MSMB1498]KWZ44167.1 hypothetical protein WS72_15770 [Burkholderia savannae]
MKFDALFEAGFKELGARFFLVAFLPILSVAVLIVGLNASGAPAASPSWASFAKAIRELDLTQSLGLIFAVLVLSLLTMPLQEALVRVLEGYWGKLASSSRLGKFFLNRQKKKRDALVAIVQNIEQPPTPSRKSEVDSAARRLLKYYPAEDRLLPTSLGNALRAAEDLATSRYGLDAVTVWPRLYPHIGEGLGRLVDSARNQLDVSVRLVPTFVVCALVSFGFLLRHGYWLLVPFGFVAMACLGYRAAVESAAAFGAVMNAAIDIHRFDMVKGLHFPMADNLASERRINQAISNFLRQGIPHELPYVHPKAGDEGKTRTTNGA